jgi:CRISPR-associated exonuclease Cas4
MTLTPSHIIEYLFCPRFTYFEYVLGIPQFEGKNFKVQKGRDIHEMKSSQNIDYLRKKIGVTEKHINQYLTNDWLRGEVDEVLELSDRTMAPLDFKFAEYKDRIFETYKTQLLCYAILIEDNFKKKVNRGYLVYVRSRNKLVEVEIGEKEKQRVKNVAEGVFEIINKSFYPSGTKYKKRCVTCTYQNLCTK